MSWNRRTLGIGLGLLWLFGAAAAEAAARRATPKRTSKRPSVGRAVKPTAAKKPVRRPATVAFTVLPGDTHAKLAADLLGDGGKQGLLRRIDSSLKPGEKIQIPAGLLLPSLSDSRKDTLVVGRDLPTLWSVARRTGAQGPAELGRTARNLQRLNAILDADKVSPGKKIQVPRSLLEELDETSTAPAAKAEFPAEETAPARAEQEERASGASFEIRKEYRVKGFDGLERRSAALTSRLRQFLTEKEFIQAHLDRGDVNLVVVHTTEHRGSTFENTASYIRRKRLANYVIGPEGVVYEVVPEQYRAFGCGDSLWDGKYIVDLEAINIEIFANTEKGDHQGAISDAQYEGLRALLADIRSRRPKIDESRIVTHRMAALNFKLGTRSRKGDPYEFDWEKAGLPDNSRVPDRDMLDGRAKLCTDCRFTDRITTGQTEAAKMLKNL